ncbi:YcjX family GTP-binding protein [Neomegalonema perideroedes]|uniref:YcjX family protein n=1 Tax=Neomegalonema perideroedes TaxID=217219 RepID=UPI000381C9A0|nr:YcjX family protein [Neomegalonema perideroedes]
MSLADWTDGLLRSVENTQRRIGESFEPSIRLGVTGLSRAGKTVFITALVANLLQRGRMTLLDAAAEGRIEAAMLRPQPNPEAPRFDYEAHRAALYAPEPSWPDSTRQISQLRVSIRYKPTGLLAGLTQALAGPSTLHLDIVDYPGEWLLDLPLLNQSYAQWARASLTASRRPERAAAAAPWLAFLETLDPAGPADESLAKEAAERFAAYLQASRKLGLSAVGPGRFLMPGDFAGSPAVTFAPLPVPEEGGRPPAESFGRLMETRFEAYKRHVVKPFFRDHFAKLDRQVVLVDALAAIDAGPAAVADLQEAMAEILACFRPGPNSWLLSLLGAKRVEKILFAATKADHVHHTQHPRLTAILKALLAESLERAAYRGAEVESLALASLRATVEQDVKRDGRILHCVRGRLLETGEEAALYPGELPENPAEIVEAARRAARDPQATPGAGWLGAEYRFMRFAPPRLEWREGEGPPHLRLDKALQFLIGDKLS